MGLATNREIAFVQEHAKKELTEREQTTMIRLLEMQHHAMLMYTSCAWFFTEISGIETDQVLQYALRAMQFARYVTQIDFREEFESRLEKAPSNVYENGAVSYRKNVLPAQSNLYKVGIMYAASALFDSETEGNRFLHYWVENERNNFSLVRKCCCCLITLQTPCTSVGAQPPRILDKGYHSATGLPKTSHHDTTRILKMDTDRICRDRTAEP